MIGFKTLPWSISRLLGRAALAGGLLCSAAAVAEDVGVVRLSSGFESDANCPAYNCPPGSTMPPGMGRPPANPSYGQPRPAPGLTQQQPSTALPQPNPQSPVPAPFTAAQAGLGPSGPAPGGLAAAMAPTSVAPNMIGDFFGAISSKPVILPGNIVGQAIYFQPMESLNGPPLLDYYRGVIEFDPMNNPGTFQTIPQVFLGGSNTQLESVVPNLTPPQLLQQYIDINGFTGDPLFITGGPDPIDPMIIIPPAPQVPGNFIALDNGDVADTVNVNTAEGPAILVDETLYTIYDALLIFVPTPGSGGGVGRQKIAENTSPIPRDRVFINHSTFNGVPLTSNGLSVYRFAPGIERAFYEERASLEVRFPFASTIDSNINASNGPAAHSTQFGNIVTTLKALVRRTPTSAVAVGVSVTAPTAHDLNVSVDGSQFLAIENESVHVMPYIGGTNTRGRWFGQWYLQGDIDSTGSPVDMQNVTTGEIEHAGNLHDAPMLYASVSGGYWIYQNGHRNVSFDSSPGRTIKRTVYTGGGGVTGLAPIMEFHFNRSLDKSEVITSGPLQLSSASDFSLTNLVVGGVMTFGTGGSLTVAWGTPIIGQDDRQYDNEIRVVLDYEY